MPDVLKEEETHPEKLLYNIKELAQQLYTNVIIILNIIKRFINTVSSVVTVVFKLMSN